ncbi:MAG: S41 family peptidase [Prevotellaceae bacterium]|jgi:carboxyl-terminal processing protease|nr:S41 family peptidase [Prevotellaceae bacterium]
MVCYINTFIKYLSATVVAMSVNIACSQDVKLKNALQKYNSVLLHIDRYYVDTVNIEQMVENSIKNSIQSLDPHSYYISKEEYQAMSEPLEGNFEGIGIEFNVLNDTLTVVSTIVGGPSEKVGLRGRDRIIKVDGNNITNIGLTTSKVHSLLRGTKGSKVLVTVKRSAEILDFEIIRDKIPINSLEAAYEPEKGTVYIKLSRFAKNSMNEIIEAFGKFEKPQSLILDLRSNGGGMMDAAIQLADQFLESNKLIVYTEGVKSPIRRAFSSGRGFFTKGNLVILIDEHSASASEIVSGAVQDWDRGLIVGRRSFGKGLVQNEFRMEDGSAVRLTVARYYTPSGRAIQSPYEKGKNEKYYSDLYSRISAEAFSADSIKFPDSLKYQTIVKKRTVYGGGGIMPDIYMPLDTSEYSKYLADLTRKGIVLNFISSYIDKNGNELKNKYATFEQFKKSFAVTADIFDKMLDYAEKEGVARNVESIRISENRLKRYMKALIARHLFGNTQFYAIINETDKEVFKALEILKNWNSYIN